MTRFLDMVFALAGLIIGFPVMAVILLIGYFETGSPIFRQERVGRHKKPFILYKFRTMKIDTVHVASHLVDAAAVTSLGRFLRHTKLDELPQLLNVLKGEMSLVGPRPCLFNQKELIAERDARGVFAVRPGITGLAQINGIDMSTPRLLAETEQTMLAELSLCRYLYYIAATALGKGIGDRIGKCNGGAVACGGDAGVPPPENALGPRIFLSPPHMCGREQEYVRQAFESNYIAPLGPMVDGFEKEFAAYTGIPHCLALSSGTAATHLALRHLGLGPGDEVVASTLTFIGSITPVTFEGATPVFIDCDESSWNLDPALLEQAVEDAARRGKPPKAVIPTDLYGHPCDLPRIRAICDRRGIPVICDSAEAMGARYQGHHAGTDAWAAVFSFNGNKIMTTAGGGMLASRDKELIDHARRLSQQARDPAPWYEHTEIGFNYRMSNILAAIGRGQLEVLEERVIRRREIFDGYRQRLGDLPGISFMPESAGCRSNRWLTVVQIDPAAFGADTHAVREALEAENIEARPLWKPMHMQPVFQGKAFWKGREAVSERLFSRGVCLPSGTAMTDADLDRVCEVVRRMRG